MARTRRDAQHGGMNEKRDRSLDRTQDSPGRNPQAQRHPAAERVGRLAHADVEHGLVDTSRSVETDQTYHRLRESAPEAGKP